MRTVLVEYDFWPGYGERRGVEYAEIVGEDDASFAEVLIERFAPDSPFVGQVDVHVAGTDTWMFAPIDRHVTMREAHEFAAGEVIPITRVGLGGGLVPIFAEWIGAGLTLVGVWDLLRRGSDAFTSAVYRRQREEARQWLVAGSGTSPHLELVQWVKVYRHWVLADARAVFGLGVREAADLLRKSGYVPEDESGETWREIDEEGS